MTVVTLKHRNQTQIKQQQYLAYQGLTCGSCGVETRNRTQLQQQQHFAYQGLTCKKYDVTYSSNFPRVELNSLFDIKFYNLISGDGHSENYFVCSKVRTYFCLMCFLIDWTILHRFSEACSSNSLAKVVFGIDISILTMMKIGPKIRGRGNVIDYFTKIPYMFTKVFGITVKGIS
ncbi:hypothetical protein GQR58_029704 [Nymphon striatum]|nr:hypothetical protein GQR58_029704 [Nymphon striatum]